MIYGRVCRCVIYAMALVAGVTAIGALCHLIGASVYSRIALCFAWGYAVGETMPTSWIWYGPVRISVEVWRK